MDRRQQRTRNAIFEAFNRLLEKKHFNSITVQEILDEANIGRSTFYSHFGTKDELLKEMCTDIFDHIFSHELHSETSHDFSLSDHGLREKITHLLYHLKDNKGNVLGILSGESGEIFMRYFKEYLVTMFEQYPNSIRQDVPRICFKPSGWKSRGSGEMVDPHEDGNVAGGIVGLLFENDRL